MAKRYADPVWPNAGVRNWYRGQLQAIVWDMAREMIDRIVLATLRGGDVAQDARGMTPKVSRTPSAWPSAAATWAEKASAARKTLQPTVLQKELEVWGVKWNKKITKASDKIALEFATKSRKATDTAMLATLKKAGLAVMFKPTAKSVAAFQAIVAENVGLIRSIPQKFLTDVQATVWQSVMAGSDLEVLAKSIHEKYGIAWRRAEFIALDQNNKAKAAMERARRLQLGIKRARWMHSHAGKEPRPTHVKAGKDRVTYDIDKGWWDPAVSKRIWPGTEPRCRCADAAEIPGFD